MEEGFLSPVDQARAMRTLRRLAKHDISHWALTGGIAMEHHLLQVGRPPAMRPLNDLDFVVESFEHIPLTLADDFLLRHIHPLDPSGKILLQCIDAQNTLRIDVFRADIAVMGRSSLCEVAGMTIPLLSLEDLIARTARLVLPLAKGLPIHSKHAKDFLRLDEIADLNHVNDVWREHREKDQPQDFQKARTICREQIVHHPELLVSPSYSTDPNEICPRCSTTSGLPLADPQIVLDIMGYC